MMEAPTVLHDNSSFLKLIFIRVYVFYNQLYVYICPLPFGLLFHSDYHGPLIRGPCAMSINRGMDKKDVVHINGILLGHKKGKKLGQ